MKYTKNNHKASPMYVKRALKWADELDKNEKKATKTMRDGNGGRCCLAVAEDLFLSRTEHKGKGQGVPTFLCDDWFGWDDNYVIGAVPVVASNDGTSGHRELTHKQIATKIRKEYSEGNLIER